MKKALIGLGADVPVGADVTRFDAAIAKSVAKIAALKKETSDLKLDADEKTLVAKIAELDKQASHLQDRLGKLKTDVDIRAAVTKISALDAQARVLRDKLADIPLGLDTARMNAEIAAENARLDKLARDRSMTLKINTDANSVSSFFKSLAARVSGGILGGGDSKSGGGGGGGGGGANLLQQAGRSINPGGAPATAQGIAVAGGAGVAALAAGFGGLIPLIVAATAGIAAFGAVALPTLSDLRTAMATVSTATDAYATASANLDTAIHQSPADLAAYRKVLKGLEPDLASAASLLTNQGVTWQSLTPKQQASVIALRDNSAAYKTLLPDQKTALNALIKEGNAWNTLSPAQQKAANQTSKLSSAFDDMVTALAPLTLQVLTDGLKVVNTLLPFLLPLATAGGKAIDGLLKGFEKFASSPGFKAFIANMTKLAGPAIAVIGEGLGKLIIAVGKLLLAMESPDALILMAGLFRVLAGTINVLTEAFKIGTPIMIAVLANISLAVKTSMAIIVGIFKVIGDVLTGNWGAAWRAIKQVVVTSGDDIKKAALNIAKAFDAIVPTKVRHDIAVVFDGVRHDIAAVFGGIGSDTVNKWNILWNNTITRATKGGHDVAAAFDGMRHDIAARIGLILSTIVNAWNTIWNNTISRLARGIADAGNLFTGWFHNLQNWWNTLSAFDRNIWDSIWNNTVSRLARGIADAGNLFAGWWRNLQNWLNTARAGIASVWDTIWANTVSRFTTGISNIERLASGWWTNIQNWYRTATSGIASAWNTIWANTVSRVTSGISTVERLFSGWASNLTNLVTKTIPNAFSTAVSAVGRFWSILVNTVKGPVNTVLQNVVDPLFGAIDDVTAFVNLGRPLPTNLKLASGGQVPGYGGGDRVRAMLEPGEAVVDKVRTRKYADVLGWMGVPGFATGGLPSPGRGGTLGVTPGTGPALGPLAGPAGSIIKVLGKAFDVAKIVGDLATGNTTGAINALKALLGGNAGGAAGQFGTTLLAVPGVLITDAMKFLVNAAKSALAPKGGSVGAGAAGPGGGAPGANAALAQRLMPAWGSGAEWNAWNALEMQEAGWNQFARNPSSGAYGIPQGLPPSKMGAAANPPQSNPTAQIRWMVSYIQSVYGDPIRAEQHELANHWYAKGGKVRGFATGGLASNLAREQAGENTAYAGLARTLTTGTAHPPKGSFLATHRKMILSELATLAKRQTLETTRYRSLSGAGLTASHLAEFATALREEARTAADKDLSGGASAPDRTLQSWLSALETTAGGGLPAGKTAAKKTSAAAAGKVPATTASGLPREQAAELSTYASLIAATRSGLAGAPSGSWLRANRVSITSELATLAKRQQAEVTAYNRLSGTGLTAHNLSLLGTATRAEARTAQDKALSRAEPGMTAALRSALAALGTGKTSSAGKTSGGSTGSKASTGTEKALLQAVAGHSLTDIRASRHLEHVWHLLHLRHLKDIGLSGGGPVRSFDSGNVMPPGLSMSWNGTGRPETLVPADNGDGRRHATLDDVHAALRDLIDVTGHQGTAFAGALNSTSNAAASRGSYSTRRLCHSSLRRCAQCRPVTALPIVSRETPNSSASTR